MRILSFKSIKWDKNFLISFIITLICSIICGIVLCKIALNYIYFTNIACEYVDKVFLFKTWDLIFPRFIADLLYLFAIMLICRFTKLKYLTLIFIFLRGFFFGMYTAVLVCVNAVGGVLAIIFVFIPSSLVSIALCYFITELCKVCNDKYLLLIPIILTLADCLITILLLNVVFRVVIIIV